MPTKTVGAGRPLQVGRIVFSDERTSWDGKPYYCSECSAGLGEFLACEMPYCRLESERTALQRRQRFLARRRRQRQQRKAGR